MYQRQLAFFMRRELIDLQLCRLAVVTSFSLVQFPFVQKPWYRLLIGCLWRISKPSPSRKFQTTTRGLNRVLINVSAKFRILHGMELIWASTFSRCHGHMGCTLPNAVNRPDNSSNQKCSHSCGSHSCRDRDVVCSSAVFHVIAMPLLGRFKQPRVPSIVW